MLLSYNQLDDYQREIGRHQKSPTNHLVVNSSPGSGKSSLIKYVVSQKPVSERNNIHVFMFNTNNKDEFNRSTNTNIAQTTSSLGYRTLAKSIQAQDPKHWLDKRKYHDIAADILDDLDFECEHRDRAKWIEAAVKLVDLGHMNLVGIDDFESVKKLYDDHGIESPIKPEDIGPVYRRMSVLGKMRASRYISFSDFLWLPHIMELEPPEYYSWIAVDEAQDTSRAARELLYKVSAKGLTFWVGDHRQAIYRWAGAPPRGMFEITAEKKADTRPNPVSYRCPKKIVEYVKGYAPEIRYAPNAIDGDIKNIDLRDVYRKFECRMDDVFLCAINKPLVEMALRMIQRGTPCRMNNHSLDRDLVDVVDVVAEKIEDNFDKFFDALQDYKRKRTELYHRTRASEYAVSNFHDKCNSLEVLYWFTYENGGREVKDLRKQIKQLFEDSGDRVLLSSIHAFKGNEAPRVFVLESTQKPATHPEDIEQRNNVAYIANTRVTQEKEGHLYHIRNSSSVGEF